MHGCECVWVCTYARLAFVLNFRFTWCFMRCTTCSALNDANCTEYSRVQLAMILWIRNWCSIFLLFHLVKKRWNFHSIIKRRVRAARVVFGCVCWWCRYFLIDIIFIWACECAWACAGVWFSMRHQYFFEFLYLSNQHNSIAPLNTNEMKIITVHMFGTIVGILFDFFSLFSPFPFLLVFFCKYMLCQRQHVVMQQKAYGIWITWTICVLCALHRLWE